MSTITFTISLDKQGNLYVEPTSQTATQKNTTITFLLGSNTDNKFEFTGYASNDSKEQLGAATISADGQTMTVPNQNTESETIDITANLTDRQSRGSQGVLVVVRNDPPH